MQTKEYILPNGKKAVFQYDITGVGKVTLECMDELMSMIADRPQGEWLNNPKSDDAGEGYYICSACGRDEYDVSDFCPNCGARMKGADDVLEGDR